MSGVSETSSATGRAPRPWGARVARLAALALLSLLPAGCAIYHHYDALSGRVVDADTGAPLEGAVVVAVYNVEMDSVGGTTIRYVDAQEVKTNAKGEFTVPEKGIYSPQFGIGRFQNEADVFVVKLGFGQYSGQIVKKAPGEEPRYLSGRHPDAAAKWDGQGHLQVFIPSMALPGRETDYGGWTLGTVTDYTVLPMFWELRNDERRRRGLPPFSNRRIKQ